MTVKNTPLSAHSEGTPTHKAAPEPLTISTATLPILVDLGYVRGWQHGHYAARQLYRMLDDGGR